MNLLEYTSTKGRSYALHPGAIRALDGDEQETRVYATVAGTPISFRVKRGYREVAVEQGEGGEV